MTRWLSEDELASWLKLSGVLLKLPPALDSQLQRDSDLTHFAYLCLAMLSEEETRTTRMSDLAARTNASLSRLSHVVTKLEQRGLVERSPCADSRRVTMVSLTDEGYRVLQKAAPGHVEAVRSLVYDGLGKSDVAALTKLMSSILTNLEGSDLDTTCT